MQLQPTVIIVLSVKTDMSVICDTVLNNHRKDYKVIKQ